MNSASVQLVISDNLFPACSECTCSSPGTQMENGEYMACDSTSGQYPNVLVLPVMSVPMDSL